MKNKKGYSISKKRVSRNKKLIAALVAIAVALVLFSLWWVIVKDDGDQNVSEQPTSEKDINFGPPSETDKEQANKTKDEISSGNQSSPTSTTNGKRDVSVIITSAEQRNGNVEVIGIINGIVEEGGVCRFVFTGSDTITKTTSGVANVSTTNCGISIPRSQFKGNSWKVTLSYESDDAIGKSASKTVSEL